MLKAPSHTRALLKPQVILPVLLAAALLAFAFSLGDLGKVVDRVGKLSGKVLWLSLAASACYLGVKAVQLWMLLNHIEVRIPARPFWLAFAVGETTMTLPLGLFSQNWVLSASRRVHVGRSSAATVMMLVAEITVVFLFLAVVGVPGWGDVRWAAIGVLALFALLILGLLLFERKARAFGERLRRPLLVQAARAGMELLDGMRKLTTPAILAFSIVLAAVYLGALTAAFWLVGDGMGVPRLDYLTATTIYAFSLAAILVGAGLFSQIGTVEVLGMVVARAWGIGYTDGLALMLGFRIVWTASIWLLCLPIVALNWREIPSRNARRSGDRGQKVSR